MLQNKAMSGDIIQSGISIFVHKKYVDLFSDLDTIFQLDVP